MLRTKKDFLQHKFDQLGQALEDAAPLPDDISIEELVVRIEAMVKKLK